MEIVNTFKMNSKHVYFDCRTMKTFEEIVEIVSNSSERVVETNADRILRQFLVSECKKSNQHLFFHFLMN
jgi:hypothetical protein